ncbi:vacuolar transporter chaperone [Mortierella claussenii]|nr:vacuolar transporter chaperone [Mortierella claussenii]
MATIQTARSLTPQPWHPDYENSRSTTPLPLDLPEDRHRHGMPSESKFGLNETNLNKNNNNSREKGMNPDESREGPVLKKTRKNIFSRLSRNRSIVTYKVSGTGRLAQFSNERLYLHWIRFGILQGTIAVTLLSFGYGVAAYVGVGALILALATLIYATTLYHLRHIYMVTKRKDIVYYERTIPTLLCLGLFVVYLANFVLTMAIGEDAKSPPPWPKDENLGHF